MNFSGLEYLRKTAVKTKVTGQSLVGVSGTAPFSWANYCWVEKVDSGHVRVLNMWAENIEIAERKFNLGGEMQVLLCEKDDRSWCIVVDERIPPEWRYDKLCFTGYYVPPLEVAQEMYTVLGDPTNEFEQFTNPKMYHMKRGGKWNDKGWVSYGIYPVKDQTWRHVKTGNLYRVEGLVHNTSTDAVDVLYKPLYDCDIKLFTRPIDDHPKSWASKNEDGTARFERAYESELRKL